MTEETTTREPTATERAQERTVIYASAADTLITISQLIVGLTSGSLAMLGDSVRATIMLSVEYTALWLMRSIHRDKLRRYQFGIGKLEQFIWLTIGLALILIGFWLINTAVIRLFSSDVAPSPLGLAFAAIVNGINVLVNSFTLFAMYRTRHSGESEVFKAQAKSRFIKVINSSALQITFTIAALATDPVIALTTDTIGATFVSLFMIYNGVRMTAKSFPHLLDAPVPSQRYKRITEVAKNAIQHPTEILNIRTRQSGRSDHVEVTITASNLHSVEQLKEQISLISEAVKKEIEDIDLAITVSTEIVSK
ncbi:MAG: cation diffusion facilitator family transporter [Proteobacteria bacterium]|nr:cation diffusion facilitator family transporter [Pseudomonadota bacterium]